MDLLEQQRLIILAREQQVLDLTRCNVTLSQGLLLEVEDPGTIDRDIVFHAVQDWADELARLEEHVL